MLQIIHIQSLQINRCDYEAAAAQTEIIWSNGCEKTLIQIQNLALKLLPCCCCFQSLLCVWLLEKLLCTNVLRPQMCCHLQQDYPEAEQGDLSILLQFLSFVRPQKPFAGSLNCNRVEWRWACCQQQTSWGWGICSLANSSCRYRRETSVIVDHYTALAPRVSAVHTSSAHSLGAWQS